MDRQSRGSRSGDSQSKTTSRKDARLSFQLEREDLAGPMFKGDILHLVTLLFATFSFALSLTGIIWPVWFKLYAINDSSDPEEEHYITLYKLWDVNKCKESDIVCFDSVQKTSTGVFHLGMWVFAVQLLCTAGLCLVFVNICMQFVNMVKGRRSLSIQNTSMLIIASAGAFLVLGGGVGQFHALWMGPLRDDAGNFLATCTLPSGFVLLGVVFCAACGVFTHVSSHGTGAVSRDTRFLYRRASMAPKMGRPSVTGMREPGLDRIKEFDLSGPPDLSSSV